MRENFARICVLQAALILASCQILGPASLKQARGNYNSAIEDTQKAEVFSNLIRVLHQEPTLFVDVAEIDASSTLSAQATPQIGGIGLGTKITDQLTGPAVTYTEQPIIKYVPLRGEELVAQIARPITVDSLADLLDSDWGLVPVLQLTLDRATPQFVDQGAALNAAAELNDYKALVLTSMWEKSDSKSAVVGLRLYLRPENPSIAPILDRSSTQLKPGATGQAQTAARRNIVHLWIRLLRIYENTQPAQNGKCAITTAGDACLNQLDKSVDAKDDKTLAALIASLPTHIDLRTVSASGTGAPPDQGPILHVRSAMGVLKALIRSGGSIREFDMDKPGSAEKLKAALDWASAARTNCLLWPNYYAFPPSANAKSGDQDYVDDQSFVTDDLKRHGCLSQTLVPDSSLDVGDFRALRRELMLYASRAFILFESSAERPDEAYVSYFDDGRWYYIAKNDGISKSNLLLLAEFLTMQAESSKTQTNPVALTVQ